jgi:hypothetical protein
VEDGRGETQSHHVLRALATPLGRRAPLGWSPVPARGPGRRAHTAPLGGRHPDGLLAGTQRLRQADRHQAPLLTRTEILLLIAAHP